MLILTPMRRLIRRAAREGNLRTLARIYKCGRNVNTLYSSAIALAIGFKKQGRERASRAMLRRARLHAADDYWRMGWAKVAEEFMEERLHF